MTRLMGNSQVSSLLPGGSQEGSPHHHACSTGPSVLTNGSEAGHVMPSTNEEAESERLTDLPKITRLIQGRTRAWVQVWQTPSPASLLCYLGSLESIKQTHAELGVARVSHPVYYLVG